MNGYSYRGSSCFFLFFASLLGRDQILKDQILSFTSKPYVEELHYPIKQTGIHVVNITSFSGQRQRAFITAARLFELIRFAIRL